MGNNASLPPILLTTVSDCYVNGKMDIFKSQILLLVKRKRENALGFVGQSITECRARIIWNTKKHFFQERKSPRRGKLF